MKSLILQLQNLRADIDYVNKIQCPRLVKSLAIDALQDRMDRIEALIKIYMSLNANENVVLDRVIDPIYKHLN